MYIYTTFSLSYYLPKELTWCTSFLIYYTAHLYRSRLTVLRLLPRYHRYILCENSTTIHFINEINKQMYILLMFYAVMVYLDRICDKLRCFPIYPHQSQSNNTSGGDRNEWGYKRKYMVSQAGNVSINAVKGDYYLWYLSCVLFYVVLTRLI